MKEHPDIVKFCHFSAYVRTRSAGILRGLTPWHTDFGTKSSVLHLVRGVQAPGTHVRSDYSQTRHIGGRPSSHKANLIPQSKRQDTTVIVIPCLCSFTLPTGVVRAALFESCTVHHTVRTRTRFFMKKGSGTFFVYRRFAFATATNTPVGCLSNRTVCVSRWRGFAPTSSAEGLLGTVNEQRQGITMIVVSCLLLCGIKFALCELDRHLYGALRAVAAYVRTGSLYTSGKV